LRWQVEGLGLGFDYTQIDIYPKSPRKQIMSGKYTPLEHYLIGIPVTQWEITLSFEEIEDILKTTLPASAYEDNRWWEHETEGNHVSKRAWANAGWKVDRLDVNRKRVKFVRVG
jgi:hypothetical protein